MCSTGAIRVSNTRLSASKKSQRGSECLRPCWNTSLVLLPSPLGVTEVVVQTVLPTPCSNCWTQNTPAICCLVSLCLTAALAALHVTWPPFSPCEHGNRYRVISCRVISCRVISWGCWLCHLCSKQESCRFLLDRQSYVSS